LALEVPDASGRVFNIGSGQPYTVLDVGDKMQRALGKQHIAPEICGKYRVGDIRHCFADIKLARRLLGYEPRVPLDEGLVELAQWLEGQVATDQVDAARAELMQRGLAI
jgi:dTDP-L-rhamnose 4-epimerase